jgi:hypothetical protein
MRIEWSASALADLDRFARFLHERYPGLAAAVAREIGIGSNGDRIVMLRAFHGRDVR